MEESLLMIFKSGELILNFVGTIADKLILMTQVRMNKIRPRMNHDENILLHSCYTAEGTREITLIC